MEQEIVYHDEPGASTENPVPFIGERGFTQVENAVIYDSVLSVGARFTYTVLKAHMYNKDHCWPGMKRLSQILDVTEKTARVYIRELEDAGLIHKRRRGQIFTNLYTLQTLSLNHEFRPVKITDPDQSFFTGPNQELSTAKEDEAKEQKGEEAISDGAERSPTDPTTLDAQDQKKPEAPIATPPTTTSSGGKTDSAEKQLERSAEPASVPETSQLPGESGSKPPAAREFVSAVYRKTTNSGRMCLDEVVKSTKARDYTEAALLGANWKRLLRSKPNLTLEESREIAETVARELCSPQRAYRALRGEEAKPERERRAVAEGYEWIFGDAESDSPATEEVVEKSTLADAPEGPERAVQRERATRILEDPETEAGRLMRDLLDGTREEVVTQRTVAVALSKAITGGPEYDALFGDLVCAYLERWEAVA